jgi:tetratricopeptide (TPR) repeat protein
MPAATQDRETQKKIISEYLKAADRYIKSTEFPKALDEVKKALGVEPNNMYATAYNERIKVAMEAARKKEEEEHLKKQAEEQKKSSLAAALNPVETIARAANAPDAKPQPAPGQTPPPSSGAQLPGDDMITKIKKDASDAAEKKTDVRIDLLKQEFTASQQKFQEDITRLAAEAKNALAAKMEAEKKLASLQSQQGKEGAGPASGTVHTQAMALLGKLFQKAWEDGVISPDERGLLTIVKTEGEVSDDDFVKMEHGSGAASYSAHLREVWKDGLVTPEEAETLEALRTTLNISAEEHFKLEAQIRKEMQAKK